MNRHFVGIAVFAFVLSFTTIPTPTRAFVLDLEEEEQDVSMISMIHGALVQRLEGTMIPSRTREYFKQRGFRFVRRAVEAKLLSRLMPSRRSFYDYLNPWSLKRAKKCMKKHWKTLQEVSHEQDVPVRVITSVIWIETLCGKHPIPDEFTTLDTLASLAALTIPHVRQVMIDRAHDIAEERELTGWEKINWQYRAEWKIGEKWLAELSAYLTLADWLGWTPEQMEEMEGSWAGAIGFGQFLPSTILSNLGRRGYWAWYHTKTRLEWGHLPPMEILIEQAFVPERLNDPELFWDFDLENWEDNIALVARHLRHNGWSYNATDQEKWDAVYAYNHSDPYVATVLRLAELLEKYEKKLAASGS